MPDFVSPLDYLDKKPQIRSVVPMDVKNYDWGKRLFEKDAPVFFNPDGSVSTHRMAAEVDKSGNWWSFPTIVRDNGQLKQLSHREAFNWNLQKGEAVPFGQDKDTALFFAAGGYKQGTPIGYQ